MRTLTPAAVLLLPAVLTHAVLAQRGSGQRQSVREVGVTAIAGVVAAGQAWTIAWQGSDNADGIVGTADGGLLFAQEQPSQVSKLDVNNRVSVFLRDTHGAGALSVDTGGRIVAVERTCTDPGRRAPDPCAEPTAVGVLAPQRKTLANSFDGKPLGRLNDLIADRKGGVYFTVGGAYYVNAAGRVTSLGDDLRTNGIILSRDERALFVTNGNVIVAFDVQPDGSVRNRRDFGRLEAGGNGDGMSIDAEGRLYVTSAPGVQVLDTAGKYLGLIPTPRSVISVAFSGKDKKTLYVVGSGALGPDGQEFTTPEGVRNNAKTIYRIPMIAQGYLGRAK
ncbi:MAG TPA: SMP-30/gluconolactonase/LRE family protein [Vicinamibacterales bacterium]